MKSIGVLRYSGGWNGGEWFLNNRPFTLHGKVYVKFGDKYFRIDSVARHGTDHDHGHAYDWTNFDVVVMTMSDIGIIVKVSLREYNLLPREIFVA